MLTIEKYVTASPDQWEIIIEGMRNPKNSWGRMDSYIYTCEGDCDLCSDVDCQNQPGVEGIVIGPNDHNLMMTLAKGGPVHAKYRRMIPVWVTINAPLYWWKEMDTYQTFAVMNSCSTMHKIHSKEFDLKDFSWEHLNNDAIDILECTIDRLNHYRDKFLESGDKDDWWQLIQLLPSSYNQKRTVFLNYEVLHNIYFSRRNHKLDEWHTFCKWIETLPYSELITCKESGE